MNSRRGFIERCVTRKLWTRSRSQDAAAKYRSHYAPYYPRLHSAFEERLPDETGRGGDRKFRKFHRENRFRLRGAIACHRRMVHRNEHELGADRYDSWHSGDYLYAICKSCRGDEKAKERIGTISWLACWCVCSGA